MELSSSTDCLTVGDKSDEMKNSLRKLFEWKRILYSDQECQLDGLEYELNELCDQRLFDVNDSALRRSALFVIDKIAQLCWQKTDFGRKALSSNVLHFIRRLFKICSSVVDRIQFDEGDVWFGGVIHRKRPVAMSGSNERYSRNSFTRNSVQLISICVHLSALLINIELVDVLSKLLNSVARFVESPVSLACTLLDNDERCLSCAVAVLHLYRSSSPPNSIDIKIPAQFDVAALFSAIIYQIGFDHSVFIDWLQSEIGAVPFVIRFLKDICSNIQHYKEAADRINEIRFDSEPQMIFDRLYEPESENAVQVTIAQLHGEQEIISEYSFSKVKLACSEINEKSQTMATQGDCSFEKIIDCFVRLSNSCERLQRAHLEPFNLQPIISLIHRLQLEYQTSISPSS